MHEKSRIENKKAIESYNKRKLDFMENAFKRIGNNIYTSPIYSIFGLSGMPFWFFYHVLSYPWAILTGNRKKIEEKIAKKCSIQLIDPDTKRYVDIWKDRRFYKKLVENINSLSGIIDQSCGKFSKKSWSKKLLKGTLDFESLRDKNGRQIVTEDQMFKIVIPGISEFLKASRRLGGDSQIDFNEKLTDFIFGFVQQGPEKCKEDSNYSNLDVGIPQLQKQLLPFLIPLFKWALSKKELEKEKIFKGLVGAFHNFLKGDFIALINDLRKLATSEDCNFFEIVEMMAQNEIRVQKLDPTDEDVQIKIRKEKKEELRAAIKDTTHVVGALIVNNLSQKGHSGKPHISNETFTLTAEGFAFLWESFEVNELAAKILLTDKEEEENEKTEEFNRKQLIEKEKIANLQESATIIQKKESATIIQKIYRGKRVRQEKNRTSSEGSIWLDGVIDVAVNWVPYQEWLGRSISSLQYVKGLASSKLLASLPENIQKHPGLKERIDSQSSNISEIVKNVLDDKKALTLKDINNIKKCVVSVISNDANKQPREKNLIPQSLVEQYTPLFKTLQSIFIFKLEGGSDTQEVECKKTISVLGKKIISSISDVLKNVLVDTKQNGSATDTIFGIRKNEVPLETLIKIFISSIEESLVKNNKYLISGDEDNSPAKWSIFNKNFLDSLLEIFYQNIFENNENRIVIAEFLKNINLKNGNNNPLYYILSISFLKTLPKEIQNHYCFKKHLQENSLEILNNIGCLLSIYQVKFTDLRNLNSFITGTTEVSFNEFIASLKKILNLFDSEDRKRNTIIDYVSKIFTLLFADAPAKDTVMGIPVEEFPLPFILKILISTVREAMYETIDLFSDNPPCNFKEKFYNSFLSKLYKKILENKENRTTIAKLLQKISITKESPLCKYIEQTLATFIFSKDELEQDLSSTVKKTSPINSHATAIFNLLGLILVDEDSIYENKLWETSKEQQKWNTFLSDGSFNALINIIPLKSRENDPPKDDAFAEYFSSLKISDDKQSVIENYILDSINTDQIKKAVLFCKNFSTDCVEDVIGSKPFLSFKENHEFTIATFTQKIASMFKDIDDSSDKSQVESVIREVLKNEREEIKLIFGPLHREFISDIDKGMDKILEDLIYVSKQQDLSSSIVTFLTKEKDPLVTEPAEKEIKQGDFNRQVLPFIRKLSKSFLEKKDFNNQEKNELTKLLKETLACFFVEKDFPKLANKSLELLIKMKGVFDKDNIDDKKILTNLIDYIKKFVTDMAANKKEGEYVFESSGFTPKAFQTLCKAIDADTIVEKLLLGDIELKKDKDFFEKDPELDIKINTPNPSLFLYFIREAISLIRNVVSTVVTVAYNIFLFSWYIAEKVSSIFSNSNKNENNTQIPRTNIKPKSLPKRRENFSQGTTPRNNNHRKFKRSKSLSEIYKKHKS